jgi:hypothetical protein
MITPDEFDTMVRDTLRDVDAHTQLDTSAPDRLIANARQGVTTVVAFRRPTRWIAPLIAAAAVVLVALAVVLIDNRGGADRTPPVTEVPRPTPTTSIESTPAPSVQGFRTTDTSYLDATHGWALGDGRCPTGSKTACASILRTTDGGLSWQPVGVPAGLVSTRDSASCGTNGTSSGPCVDRIVFATQGIGYLWSYRGFYMTTDGGVHWTNLADQHVTQLVVVDGTAVRMSTRHGCSSGCSFGVFAAPIGTTQWKNVIPYSPGGTLPWDLAGGSGVAYVLEQFASQPLTPDGQALYRSTDGTHWARVTTSWPCGKKGIDTINVDLAGLLSATCA